MSRQLVCYNIKGTFNNQNQNNSWCLVIAKVINPLFPPMILTKCHQILHFLTQISLHLIYSYFDHIRSTSPPPSPTIAALKKLFTRKMPKWRFYLTAYAFTKLHFIIVKIQWFIWTFLITFYHSSSFWFWIELVEMYLSQQYCVIENWKLLYNIISV